jgi:hypothetical protein
VLQNQGRRTKNRNFFKKRPAAPPPFLRTPAASDFCRETLLKIFAFCHFTQKKREIFVKIENTIYGENPLFFSQDMV